MPHYSRDALEQAVREGQDLSNLDFTVDQHEDPSLFGIDLDGIQVPQAKMNDSTFTGLELMTGGNYRGINLRRAKMAGVDMTGSDFTDANFDDADLTGAVLTGATFTRASFKRTLLNGVVAIPATFVEADMDSADLRGADFTASDMRGVSIAVAWCDDGTDFTDTALEPKMMPITNGSPIDVVITEQPVCVKVEEPLDVFITGQPILVDDNGA